MEALFFVAGAIVGLVLGTAAAARRARHEREVAEQRSTARRREEQEALVGTIASGLAHEIRNPLSTLRMNLQLLREDWGEPITEREVKGRRKIDVLLRETERLENVLTGFLGWASGHRLRLEPTDLNQLAGELLDFMAPQAERSRVRFLRELSPDVPPVEVDANLIRQALVNLLVNAMQVMPGGGDVTLRTASNGRFVRLSVSDTGPGIPPEHREKIFNLYFSTRPGGTGLGLPMVKKIVEEHGGAVEVDSRPSHGATFTLCLKKPGS